MGEYTAKEIADIWTQNDDRITMGSIGKVTYEKVHQGNPLWSGAVDLVRSLFDQKAGGTDTTQTLSPSKSPRNAMLELHNIGFTQEQVQAQHQLLNELITEEHIHASVTGALDELGTHNGEEITVENNFFHNLGIKVNCEGRPDIEEKISEIFEERINGFLRRELGERPELLLSSAPRLDEENKGPDVT